MCVGKTEVDKKIHVEIESLRLEFLYTIFFLRSFFFFFPHLSSHSLLPSPKNPRQFFLLHLNPFLKISNPFLKSQTQKSRSQLDQKSKPKNHDFGTRALWVWRSRHWRNIYFFFSLLWVCVFISRFVFSGMVC